MSALAEKARGPTSEKGSVRPELLSLGRSILPNWGALSIDTIEDVDELRWPLCLDVYWRMLTDPQVWALVQAVALPVQRYAIELDPAGLDERLADLLADDLDLPLQGAERVSDGRSPQRFNARRHFARALSALNVGHAVFEHVGYIDDNGRWRLTDLAPRPAKTITDWFVDKQGRLERVEQGYGMQAVRLEADRIAVYSWQGEVGDPRGQSMLRPLYRSWVARDRLIRLDVVKHERNSMGIPVGWVSEGNTPSEAYAMDELLQGVGAGEQAFVRLQGVGRQDFRLRGVEGSTSDTVASINLHSEEMARAMHAMIVQAGQTATGNRALGQTQLDFLGMFHDAVVQWYCDTLTEQVAARWVARNAGSAAPVPRIVWAREEHETIQPSGAAGEPAPVAASGRRGTGSTRPRAGRSRRPVAAAAPVVNGRRLHRALNEHELAAAVDVAQIDTEWLSTRDELSAALLDVRAQLTTSAVEAIEEMDSVQVATLGDDVLALLAETSIDTDAIVDLLTAAAARGVAQVVGEAARQGADVDAPDVDYEDAARAEAAGMVGRLRRQVADGAQTAAQTTAAPDAESSTVARAVSDHLDGLTSAAADRAAAGATSRATHAGRTAAIDTIPYRDIYASALLDNTTCSACVDWDGHQFDSLADALAQFPSGGNKDCEGFDQCRCTVVAVLETEQEAAT